MNLFTQVIFLLPDALPQKYDFEKGKLSAALFLIFYALELIAFKSSKADVSLLTKVSSPLRNQTRGS